MPSVSQELERLSALLEPDRTRLVLVSAPPEVPPEALGALAGVGFSYPDPALRISVYVFEKQAQHAQAFETLRQRIPLEGRYVLQSSNGAMAYFGHVPMKDPKDIQGRFALSRTAAAFAGDE